MIHVATQCDLQWEILFCVVMDFSADFPQMLHILISSSFSSCSSTRSHQSSP
ncbi:hypothetical protein SLEP1_g37484 [Rubroshorea leprosula]|uniref:Uncharacterized protein n=1 Tax=Rubroshorea leprosula TaxID=152421 RepID=A0AAV5KV63_9ROSI|nr:hypothetical protein SLEP1_g37484 [Rubroshorea leprosula]